MSPLRLGGGQGAGNGIKPPMANDLVIDPNKNEASMMTLELSELPGWMMVTCPERVWKLSGPHSVLGPMELFPCLFLGCVTYDKTTRESRELS